MTDLEAKQQTLKNQHAWLHKLFGPYITAIDIGEDGRYFLTVTLSHLSSDEQAEIIYEYGKKMNALPEKEVFACCFV